MGGPIAKDLTDRDEGRRLFVLCAGETSGKVTAMDGQTQTHRAIISSLVPESGPVVLDLPLGQCQPGGAGWHDEMYRAAAGDMAKVPWAHGRASPSLVSNVSFTFAKLVRKSGSMVTS